MIGVPPSNTKQLFTCTCSAFNVSFDYPAYSKFQNAITATTLDCITGKNPYDVFFLRSLNLKFCTYFVLRFLNRPSNLTENSNFGQVPLFMSSRLLPSLVLRKFIYFLFLIGSQFCFLLYNWSQY